MKIHMGVIALLRDKFSRYFRSEVGSTTPATTLVVYPWITLLPNEIILQLIIQVQTSSEHEFGCLAFTFAFPEFRRLTVFIMDSCIMLTDLVDFGYKVVSLQDYATSDSAGWQNRPIKIFIFLFDNLRLPSRSLDVGSCHALLGRFLNSYSIVISTGTSPSLERICQTAGVSNHRTYDLPDDARSEFDCSRPELLDCASLNVPSLEEQFSIKADDRPGYSLELYRPQPDSGWQFLTEGLQVLKVFNTKKFKFDCPARLRKMEIMLSNECNGGDAQSSCEHPMVFVTNETLPIELLHITFTGHLVPVIKCPVGPTYGWNQHVREGFRGSTLVLENSEWSPDSPYGVPIACDPTCIQDSATWGLHNRLFSSFMKKASRYRIHHLIGIPDIALSNVSVSTFSLYWQRLSPRVPTRHHMNEDLSHPRLFAHAVSDLRIESVIRRNESFLKIATGNLKTLTLISLRDSDIAWNLNDILYWEIDIDLFDLERVYIERRTDNKDREHTSRIGITANDLSMASLDVRKLHLRGYDPLLALSSTPPYPTRFEELKTLMLDISQASTHLKSSLKRGSEERTIELLFRERNFPLLNELILMCPREAYWDNTFSNTHIEITIETSSLCVLQICSLINALEFKVNGNALVVPKDERMKKRVHVPVVESRRCFQWVFGSLNYQSGLSEFVYDKEIILGHDYWLRDVREY